mmetsp:Transcript_43724/g.126280  ORF Transcript_43724/g.126280 Transcript_43724/m.126280 type:complete len:220 (+) Transcript_43724:959-1618(+)
MPEPGHFAVTADLLQDLQAELWHGESRDHHRHPLRDIPLHEFGVAELACGTALDWLHHWPFCGCGVSVASELCRCSRKPQVARDGTQEEVEQRGRRSAPPGHPPVVERGRQQLLAPLEIWGGIACPELGELHVGRAQVRVALQVLMRRELPRVVPSRSRRLQYSHVELHGLCIPVFGPCRVCPLEDGLQVGDRRACRHPTVKRALPSVSWMHGRVWCHE